MTDSPRRARPWLGLALCVLGVLAGLGATFANDLLAEYARQPEQQFWGGHVSQWPVAKVRVVQGGGALLVVAGVALAITGSREG